MINLPGITEKSTGTSPRNPAANDSLVDNRIWRVPAANLDKNEDEYLITLASPGMQRQDFTVHVRYPLLIIRAKKNQSEPNEAHTLCEFDFSGWERVVELPDDADVLFTTATYYNGELRLHIPRSKTAANDREEMTIHVY
jgi:HSP20 family protein